DAYEDSLFCSEAGNWRDLRHAHAVAFGESWCHGAPGILHARLAAPAAQNTHYLRAALSTTRALGYDRPDSLCCGNFGIIDILLAAGERLGDQEIVETAHQRATDVLARASS